MSSELLVLGMDKIGARIKLLRRYRSQREFVELLNYSAERNFLSRVERGVYAPRVSFIQALAAYSPKLRMEWLIRGEGDMYDWSKIGKRF